MVPAINGYKITFHVDEHVDTLIIPAEGIETEDEAIGVAILAARHGYFTGLIDIKSVQHGRWTPFGLWANPEHTAIYLD